MTSAIEQRPDVIHFPRYPGDTLPGKSPRGRRAKPPKKAPVRPRVVSSSFRQLVLDTYPALRDETALGWCYRRIMEFCLFQPYYKDNDRLELRFPHEIVAQLVGVSAHTHGHSASSWIEAFSADVLDLRFTEYRPKELVRTIQPDIDPRVIQVRDAEVAERVPTGPLVWFVDGRSVSSGQYQEVVRQHKEATIALTPPTPLEHPAAELCRYLNDQSPELLDRMIAAKWSCLFQMRDSLPRGNKRDAVTRVLDEIRFTCPMHYSGKTRTTRIYATGTTIHQLPKAFRKKVLDDCISLDLKAAQLAILAVIWKVPGLQVFLNNGGDFWSEMFSFLGVDSEAKEHLKPAIYSIAFGRDDAHILAQVAYGEGDVELDNRVNAKRRRRPADLDEVEFVNPPQELIERRCSRREWIEAQVAAGKMDEGLGIKLSTRFIEHPLVQELLNIRRSVRRHIKVEGGALDAFGQWIALAGDRDAKSVMAAVAQSWELRLMLAVLPVLRADSDVRLVSWLHDGITVQVPLGEEGDRKILRLQTAVNTEAERFGIQTRLLREIPEAGPFAC